MVGIQAILKTIEGLEREEMETVSRDYSKSLDLKEKRRDKL